jgi:DNA/RNA endonuclease YhcR with UshA esterase domain
VKSKAVVLLIMAATISMAPGETLAHHGLASYDTTKTVTVTGTVTKFDFINPHSAIHIDVKDDTGNIENWLIEADSPNNLARAHWNKDSLKPGDQVSIVGNRMKNGSKVMRLQKAVFSNGRELKPREGDEY